MKVSYSTRLSVELLNWLVEYSKSSGLSQTSIVEAALIAYREKANKRKGGK